MGSSKRTKIAGNSTLPQSPMPPCTVAIWIPEKSMGLYDPGPSAACQRPDV